MMSWLLFFASIFPILGIKEVTMKWGITMEQNEWSHLTEIMIPTSIIGDVTTFTNFDPIRIEHFIIEKDHVKIYLSEVNRMEAIREFQTTIEAFQYEVERGLREETVSFKSFDYDFDYTHLNFAVYKHAFEEDISAEMIEKSIVYDALMYQLYSKKPLHVMVKYVDAETRFVFLKKTYPGKENMFL